MEYPVRECGDCRYFRQIKVISSKDVEDVIFGYCVLSRKDDEILEGAEPACALFEEYHE